MSMQIRRWKALATAVALAFALAACGGGDGEAGGGDVNVEEQPSFPAGSAMARLADKGSVTVGTKFDQPLFGLKGLDGKPQGFDVEIAKIIAGALGVEEDKITWSETPSAIREEVIEQGKVDYVVATYTINDKRKERITFAGPYYQAGQDLMVLKGNPKKIEGPESLKPTGAKVCSVTGSTPSETIKQYIEPSQLTLFDVYSKCADALRTGQIDVVTTDNVILLGLIEQGQDQFELVGKPFTEEPYGIGIKKGDTAFCQFINDTLKKAAEDGSYEKAWQDTAGKVAEETPQLPAADPCA
jgi:glutamate transport system substrate-binding protein